MTQPKIAVFDFDKTITSIDSFNYFFITQFGLPRFLFTMIKLSPYIFLYLLGRLKNHEIKQKILSSYYLGKSYDDFSRQCQLYACNNLLHIIRPKYLDRIQWHKKNGHILVLLSASCIEWLESWGKLNGFDYIIGSDIEVIDGVITGKIEAQNNCHGENKLIKLKAQFPELESYYMYAYGDSKSDKYILNKANEAFYRACK